MIPDWFNWFTVNPIEFQYLHIFSTKFISIDIRFNKICSHVVTPIKILYPAYLFNCMASTIPIKYMQWSQHKDSQVLGHLVSICYFTKVSIYIHDGKCYSI